MLKSNRASYDGRILLRERDLQLGLKHPRWPMEGCSLGESDEEPPPGAEPWQRKEGFLYRTIAPKQQPLWEVMLRFPNAPIYGLHERGRRAPQIRARPNSHTLRVIGLLPDTPKDLGVSERRIRDVYILHNGLNETTDAELHYQLASRLLEQSKRPAVCILRPFPNHLTRYPYNAAFAERPLDSFLLDAGDLFRQFVRFMLETRWLLSILVPRTDYDVMTGGKLVPRGDSTALAQLIADEWKKMDSASLKDPHRPRMAQPDVDWRTVKTTIDVLRNELLHWKAFEGSAIPNAADDEPPAVHVVGYSLGGFLAQSAFFAWPYAISSCVTLFGGGELRKLAPTAFAEPEEWQSVLHSLRYELDRAMTRSLRPGNRNIRGVDQETFEYLLRVFYEVFLQYYQGSYKTRMAEFIQRMLFVTGGQDPIVSPDNVLEAAPPEGVNLISIAGMSHFPMKPKERVQQEQREFWLEQLGQIVPAFSEVADERRLDVLHRSWLNEDKSDLHEEAMKAYEAYKDELDEIGEPPTSGVVTTGVPLADRWFGKEIEHLSGFITGGSKGWVLVSRNEVPPVFQTEDVLRRYAASLHHSEDHAADEFKLALERQEALTDGRDRVTLIVTDSAIKADRAGEKTIFPSRSETPGVPRLSKAQREAATDHFVEQWLKHESKAVRVLTPGEFDPAVLKNRRLVELVQRRDEAGANIQIRFLPDVWIGFHEELLAQIEARHVPASVRGARRRAELAIVGWAVALLEERRKANRRDEAGAGEEQTDWAILEGALDERTISIVEFSRAGLNPRYRGKRLTEPKRASDVLVHWALAYQVAVEDGEKTPEPRRRPKRG